MATPRVSLPEEVDEPEIDWLTDAEKAELFEAAAQRWLSMSTQEFLAALDAGGFGDDLDYWPVINVAGLLYLVRPEQW